jgi:hypothetical protein
MQSARLVRLGKARTAAAISTTSSVYYLRPRTESDNMVGYSTSNDKPNMCTVNRAQFGPIPTTKARCTFPASRSKGWGWSEDFNSKGLYIGARRESNHTKYSVHNLSTHLNGVNKN